MKTADRKPEIRMVGGNLPDGAKALFDTMMAKFKGRELQVGAIFGVVSVIGSMSSATYKSGLFTTVEFEALQGVVANTVVIAGEAMGLSIPAVNEVVDTYGEIMSFAINGVKQ